VYQSNSRREIMDSLITIPLSVMLTILFLIVVLLCFNAFTFYKWSCSIEEYETLKKDYDDFKSFINDE
jgi:hypothetical protein